MIKVRFKEWPDGDWQDWSKYLINSPSITRRVESQNSGEAGLICFNTVKIELYTGLELDIPAEMPLYAEEEQLAADNLTYVDYGQGTVPVLEQEEIYVINKVNPVNTYFNYSLTSVNRFLFEISTPNDSGIYVKLFEGLADLSTIEWEDHYPRLSVILVDKLAAMSFLESELQRASFDSSLRVTDHRLGFTVWPGEIPGIGNCWIIFPLEIGLKDFTAFPSLWYSVNAPILNKGEILQNPGYPESNHLIIDSGVVPIPAETVCWLIGSPLPTNEWMYKTPISGNATWIKCYPELPSSVLNWENYIGSASYYSKLYYGRTDICNYDIQNNRTIVKSFDGIKILGEIIKQQWPEISIVNRTGNTTFDIPIDYFDELIDEAPFGTHPLEALKKITDLMQCYLFANSAGNIVIQNKEHLGSNGAQKHLLTTRVISGKKKFFWDKLIDAVEITAESYLRDEAGDKIVGYSYKQYGSLSIKPRNTLEKTIIVNTVLSQDIQQARIILNDVASQIATKYLEFYGKRHEEYKVELDLDNNTLTFDLLDNVIIAGTSYFMAELDAELAIKTITISLVSVESFDYNNKQIMIGAK